MTARKTVSKIVVTGDFLRPVDGATVPSQVRNINWLGKLISEPIKQATGHDIEICTWDDNSDTGLSTACIKKIYEEFQENFNISGWANIYSENDRNNCLNDLIERRFKNTLVIGFEIPPVVQNALNYNKVPYVSVAIHPIRYLDDIIFGFNSNMSTVRSALEHYRIDEDYFYKMAGVQAASALKTSYFTPEENSLLIVGQTQFDASCIENKRFVSLLDYKRELAKLASGKSKIYFKPHPLQTDAKVQEKLNLELGMPVEVVNENIYYLLSQPNITDMVMLSSSVGIEAKYFRKRATCLIEGANKQWLSSEHDGMEAYVPVNEHWLDADFWRQALDGLTAVTQMDGKRIKPKPNRLRISLGQFWSYNRTDSDIMISLGMQPGTEACAQIELHIDQLSAQISNDLTMKGRALDLHVESLTSATRKNSAEIEAQKLLHEQILSSNKQIVANIESLLMLQKELQIKVINISRDLSEVKINTSWNIFERILLRRSGRPIKAIRRVFFHLNGKPRGVFRDIVLNSAGLPRSFFKHWMSSSDYLRLPNAIRTARPETATVAENKYETTTAWRAVLTKDHLSDAELDILMDKIRSELNDQAGI